MAFPTAYSKKFPTFLFRNRQSFVKLSTQKSRYILPSHMLYFKMISFVGEEHADVLMTHLENELKHTDVPVMEMRASNGPLTKKLIDAGVKNLHVFEKRKNFQPILKDMASQHKDSFVLHQRTFNETFFEANNLPVYNSLYLQQSLPFSLKRSWQDSPSVKIIAAHSNGKVMIVALAHIAKNMMYCGMGRPEFILSVPLPLWEKLSKHPFKTHYNEYLTAALLFPNFYEIKILGIISPPVRYNEGDSKDRVSKEPFVTVSVSPHKDLEKMATPELLEEFLFFGTQTMNGKAKHMNIIPTLERWTPGCGKDLVMSGVDCFTKFCDLTPHDALKLFKTWKSLPHYSSSVFSLEYKDYLLYSKY